MSLSRVHLCQTCGEPWEEQRVSAQGRPPTACPTCDPDGAVRREQVRAKRAGLQAQYDAAQERIAELEAQLAAYSRTSQVREPGKASLGRAVRRVAYAEGSENTRRALLDLADHALAWAARLAVPTSTPDGVGDRAAAEAA